MGETVTLVVKADQAVFDTVVEMRSWLKKKDVNGKFNTDAYAEFSIVAEPEEQRWILKIDADVTSNFEKGSYVTDIKIFTQSETIITPNININFIESVTI
jgi:hypothetical protein